jgi:hypothetical protein
MKNFLLSCYFNIVLVGFSLAQGQENLSTHHNEAQQIYLAEISQEEIQHCMENPSSCVLVCQEGTRLPINFFLKGELMELIPSVDFPTIVIKRSFYMRIQNEQLLMSLDGKDWKNWQELVKGNLSIGLDASEGIPKVSLGAECLFRNEK